MPFKVEKGRIMAAKGRVMTVATESLCCYGFDPLTNKKSDCYGTIMMRNYVGSRFIYDGKRLHDGKSVTRHRCLDCGVSLSLCCPGPHSSLSRRHSGPPSR